LRSPEAAISEPFMASTITDRPDTEPLRD
jgi:hypothetical protein